MLNRILCAAIMLATLPAAHGQEITVKTLDDDPWKSLHQRNKATFVPKNFQRDIPYASLVTNLAPLASRVNDQTRKMVGRPVFGPRQPARPDMMGGEIQWVVDDSQETVVGKSILSVHVRTAPTLDAAVDRFIDFSVVQAIFKPCSVPGPRLGDLCICYEETGSLTAILVRNNLVVHISSSGTFRVPRYPGVRANPSERIRPDTGNVKRGWELVREIDNMILELSGNTR